MPLTTALNAALDKIAGNMEVQRRFMNNVAHELRTPLTVMRGGSMRCRTTRCGLRSPPMSAG
jgi:signal transduction histidine kinase